MKTSFKTFWATIALITLPGTLLAQATAPAKKDFAVAGYTDAQGKALPSGDIRINVKSDGKTTTLTLENLCAFGEANVDPKDLKAERKACYNANPDYFKGSTAYIMKLGNDWRGGRTAASVDLKADGGLASLASAKVGDNQVTFTFPSRKAGQGVKHDCQPINYLLVKADGVKVWLGHPGWKSSNDSPGIGDYTGLVRTADFEKGDGHYPFGALCYNANGLIDPLTPQMRNDLARIVQPPSDYKPRNVAEKKPQDD